MRGQTLQTLALFDIIVLRDNVMVINSCYREVKEKRTVLLFGG